MKTRPGIISVVLISLLVISGFAGCRRSPRCAGHDENRGIIISEVPELCSAFIPGKQFVIENDSVFKEVLPSWCSASAIDFNAVTVLGRYASGGCAVKFIRDVEKVEKDRKYVYRIRVRDCGRCKSFRYSHNFVTVPKLPEGWTVSFSVKEDI